MFCTKLKDLKITGECPFSLLTKSQGSEEGEDEVSDNAAAALPICKEVSEMGTPAGSEMGTPGGSEMGTPGGSEMGTPGGSEMGTPDVSKMGTPGGSKMGTPGVSKMGTPGVSKMAPPGAGEEGPPQRKSSRSRVYLHTLAESIRKLIFPEFDRLNLALQRTIARQKAKCNRSACVTFKLHGMAACGKVVEKDFDTIVIDQSNAAGVPVELIKETLGEELFKICYEEDEHVLEVIGGTLKDFLNSFSTHLKQSGQSRVQEEYGGLQEGSILCLEKDQDFLNVYYFFPNNTTILILPGIIKAAAFMLYETVVEVQLIPHCFNDGNEFIKEPYLLYSVKVKNTRPSLSPCKPQSNVVISASIFCKTFPFHFMFDKDMTMLQIGNGVKRLLNRRDIPGKSSFEEHFEILSPKISCTFSGIMTMLNMQFVIRVKRWDSANDKSTKVRKYLPNIINS